MMTPDKKPAPVSAARNADGDAERTLWTLHQDSRRARCTLLRRRNGWELRMFIDDLTLLVEVCCSPEQVLTVAQEWKARLRPRGWCELRSPSGS